MVCQLTIDQAGLGTHANASAQEIPLQFFQLITVILAETCSTFYIFSFFF